MYAYFTQSFHLITMSKFGRILQKLTKKFIDLTRETSIHGIPLIAAARIHILERLIWTVIVISSASAAIGLALENIRRYNANPTVVQIQKNFRDWYNTFPSATICLMNKVDSDKAYDYILAKWKLDNESHPKFSYYENFINAVANVSYSTLEALEQFADDPELNDFNFTELAWRVHPDIGGNLVTYDPNQHVDWTLMMTEKGICSTVNSKYAKLFGLQSIQTNFNASRNDDSVLECHYLNGLCYARYDSEPDAPLQIFIHSYLDVIHASSGHPLYVKESEELEIYFRMQETKSSPSLRYLKPSQRRCRFDYEAINDDIPAYSTSICYIACRHKLVLNLCGCKPFFYFKLPGRTCTLKELECVATNADYLMQSPIALGCDCAQPCDLITYLPEMPKVTVWEYGYFDQRITFRWGLLPPTTRYKRDIIFSFDDLVVSIGGTLALFLGISFITAVEILFGFIEILYYSICRDERGKKEIPKRIVKRKRKEVQNNIKQYWMKRQDRSLPIPYCN